MEHLPSYIGITFYLLSLLALLLLYKASRYAAGPVIAVLLWIALQSVISLQGFYTVIHVRPPRFGLLLLPPLALIILGFSTRGGRRYIARFDSRSLTLLHIIRVPVELTLYWLFLQKAVPKIMTFEGRNFDILCGLTAPIVYYWGYVKNVLGRKVLLAWNIVCLLLVTNIAIIAVLSAPFPLQKFGFDQPDIALLYFPYTWLPCFLVPTVIFAHLAAIRALWKQQKSLQSA